VHVKLIDRVLTIRRPELVKIVIYEQISKFDNTEKMAIYAFEEPPCDDRYVSQPFSSGYFLFEKNNICSGKEKNLKIEGRAFTVFSIQRLKSTYHKSARALGQTLDRSNDRH
jgi:hypothetical protein